MVGRNPQAGQGVLVQVTKDPIGHKGARLTSQISLAGRFLVYVPDGTTSGISRKLPDTERNRLKTLLKEIVPDTAGVIVRTAAEGASEDELTRDVERLKAAYDEAVAEAGTARDSFETARTQDDRQQKLLGSGVVSQSAADDSALKLQIARGAVTKAESAVVSARASLAGDPEIATDRHPDVLEALASLHAAELDLARTRVVAPDDGIVSQADRLQRGQYVTPAVPVLSLVAAGDSWIEANYKETELTHMHPGQRAEITVDTYGDVALTGEIASIGAGTGSEFALLPPQNATGNWVKVVQRVPVRISIDAGQNLPTLRAGMSARVSVDTGHARGLPGFVSAGTTASVATGDR